jgi:DNA-binding Lrp family transcriptional regulator
MTDPVSTTRLAEKCNLSEAGVKLAVKSLEAKGYIKVHRDLSGNPMGGNRYEVLTGLLTNPVSNQPGKSLTGPESSRIKDHEDLKNTYDHQSETRRLYQSITGNAWTKADEKAYHQIAAVPLERIEPIIRAVLDRAKDQPRSLNYFVGEILAAGKGRGASSTDRRALERIIAHVRELQVGGDGESLRHHVERECKRRGVIFDPEILSEIIKP